MRLTEPSSNIEYEIQVHVYPLFTVSKAMTQLWENPASTNCYLEVHVKFVEQGNRLAGSRNSNFAESLSESVSFFTLLVQILKCDKVMALVTQNLNGYPS